MPVLHRTITVVGFVLLLCASVLLPAPSAHAQKHPECSEWYSKCNEQAKLLPGSYSDQNSAYYKAIRLCGAVGSACEFRDDGCTYDLPALHSVDGFLNAPSMPSPVCGKAYDPSEKARKVGLIATVKSFDGDVKVRTGNGDSVPLKKGQSVQMKPGDRIITGFDGSATLAFNDGQDGIDVYHMTELRMDNTLLKESRSRTQLSLRVGSVKAYVKHTAAIRGDFSVVTPTSISGVRDSAMIVRYDDQKQITTVHVTDDKAYVTPKTKGAKEITVKQGYTVTIGVDGKMSTPKKFGAEELPDAQGQEKKPKVVQTPGKPSKVALPGVPAPSFSTPSRLPVVKTLASAAANGYPAKNATDDSPTSMWVASMQTLTDNNNVWISLDFGAPKNVQKLKWHASAWEKPYPSNGPSKYRIQRSDDGQAWTDVGAVVDLGIDGKDPRQITGSETINVTARYLRLKVERVNDGTGWSLGLKDFWAEGSATAKSTPDKQTCSKQYEICIDASRKLPGSLFKKGSPMNNAWAECTRQSQLCEQKQQK